MSATRVDELTEKNTKFAVIIIKNLIGESLHENREVNLNKSCLERKLSM